MRHFPKVLLSSLLLVSLTTSACHSSTSRYGQTTNASSLAEEKQSSPHQPAKNSSYWINVGSTSNESLIDVDTNSIQINGSSAIYFTRMRHNSPPNGVSITAVHEVMDCRSGLYQSLEYMSFSNQGRMLGSSQEPSSISQTKPGTLQAGVYGLVCGQTSTNFDPALNQQTAMKSFRTNQEIAKMASENYSRMSRMNAQALSEAAMQRWNSSSQDYPCDYTTQIDSLGRACGGRAAIVRPGRF